MTGTSYMAGEIASQPKLWMETYESVLQQKQLITDFLSGIYSIANLQVVLSGAGSSAFIGEIVQNAFARNTGIPVKSIPTTDIVTHPRDNFQRAIPTLLVSFARSGDSPESIAAFEIAERSIDHIYHLVITCNPQGSLAKIASGKKNSFVFLLPQGTNDQALAMTSSFTCMALAGLLMSDIAQIQANEGVVKKLSRLGQILLDSYAIGLSEVADLDFKRIVFLGSGPLKGTAKESHLKVIELTDGQVMCQYDSFLGFRHGPKAVIDESTLLVYLFSNDPYVYNYEIDLVNSINQTENVIYSIGIGQPGEQAKNLHLDLNIELGLEDDAISDDFFAICGVIPAQVLGFYKSLSLGLTPDSPSKNGGIHRVVQGVNIYPY